MAPWSPIRTVCLLGICYIILMSMINVIASEPQYDIDKPRDSDYLNMKLQNLLRRSELSDSAVKGLLNHRTKRVFCNTFGGCTSFLRSVALKNRRASVLKNK